MDNLIAKAKMRDADAFTRLMQSQMQNMYKTARAILYHDEDAADAISETILTCWEKIGQLRQDHYFRTWMTRILVNHCNDILRKRKNICLMEELPEVSYSDSAYENMEWEEALRMLDESTGWCFFSIMWKGLRRGRSAPYWRSRRAASGRAWPGAEKNWRTSTILSRGGTQYE